jgi:Ca2+-binding RTX toxin-like protein
VALGGAGDDFVSGDRGTDTLTGGAGADRFHVFAGAGADRVTDFNAAEGDRVQLLAGATWTVRQAGADTVVDLGEGDTLTLAGVDSASLPTGWIFAG